MKKNVTTKSNQNTTTTSIPYLLKPFETEENITLGIGIFFLETEKKEGRNLNISTYWHNNTTIEIYWEILSVYAIYISYYLFRFLKNQQRTYINFLKYVGYEAQWISAVSYRRNYFHI